MTSTPPPRTGRVVEVWGDATIDWLIVTPPDGATAGLTASYQWEARPPARIVALPGGAALLRDMLAAVAQPAGEVPIAVHGTTISPPALSQTDDASHPHTIA